MDAHASAGSAVPSSSTVNSGALEASLSTTSCAARAPAVDGAYASRTRTTSPASTAPSRKLETAAPTSATSRTRRRLLPVLRSTTSRSTVIPGLVLPKSTDAGLASLVGRATSEVPPPHWQPATTRRLARVKRMLRGRLVRLPLLVNLPCRGSSLRDHEACLAAVAEDDVHSVRMRPAPTR
jgi:hypothetical protein